MESQSPDLINAYRIALRLGRSPKCVRETILRMKIDPILELEGGHRYYHPDAVDQIRAAMRQPNRRKES